MNKKLDLAYRFFDVAKEQLKKYKETKDEVCLRQASEKGWSAVAQALKAVNPKIRRHADFGKTASMLATEYNNEEIMRCEAFGEHLHRAGFYEGLLDIEEVRHGFLAVEDFLKLIDNILLNGKEARR